LQSALPFESLAVNGVGDVLRNGIHLARAYLHLKRQLRNFRPDLVLLVDYPGMNAGLARTALRLGYRVHYVAPPQLWAYRHPEGRLRKLQRALSGASLQVLFPFEAGRYESWTTRLCQGHFFSPPAPKPPDGNRLLLCPGSRRGIVLRNLPLWWRRLSDAGWRDGVDVLTPEFLVSEVKAIIKNKPEVSVFTDSAQAFSRAASAIAFPGTMTLELFLARIPARAWAVLDPLTLWAGRRKMRNRFTALPNLLLDREIFPEWVGTADAFRKNPPPWPDSVINWPSVSNADVMSIQEKMGSPDGVKTGVRACLELLSGNFHSRFQG
jgi:lipid-A-disaccharide synthase